MASGIHGSTRASADTTAALKDIHDKSASIFLASDRARIFEIVSSALRTIHSLETAEFVWSSKTTPLDDETPAHTSAPAAPLPPAATEHRLPLALGDTSWGTLVIRAPGHPATAALELAQAWCGTAAAALAAIAQAGTAARAERLQAVSLALGRLVHDIRSPLTAVGLGVELVLMDGVPKEMLKESGGKIQQSLKEINIIAEDLLGFARGKITANLERTDLATFIPEVYKAISQIHRGGAPMELHTEGTELWAMVDHLKIRRITHNLVKNAQHALREFKDRPKKINITIRPASSGERVEYIIADTGPGIPAEVRKHLFQPFVSCNTPGGTGLGLAMAKMATESMGATLPCETSPATGTSFTLSFPLATS